MTERGLQIAIDGRELVNQPTGVGRYLLEILRQWVAAPTPHRYTVIVPAEPSRPLLALGDRVAWRVEPDTVGGTWWEQVRLPRAVAATKADVLFAPGYTAPLRLGCPFVLAVYDVSFWARPDWFGWREGLRRRWITRASARRARTVVTISGFSRDEIRRYLGVAGNRIVLAPPGAPSVAETTGGSREPVVLYVGSLFNRRHVPDMIRAFAKATRSIPDARFVVIGDNRTSPRLDLPALAADAGVADRVEWQAYVDDAERDRHYQTARAFLFLSDYEGFGMTPLEAAAFGVPSVVLDTDVSREVYGEGAILVPADPDAIAGALTRLLTDSHAHAATVAAAQARLSHFSWVRSAQTITRALEEAAR